MPVTTARTGANAATRCDLSWCARMATLPTDRAPTSTGVVHVVGAQPLAAIWIATVPRNSSASSAAATRGPVTAMIASVTGAACQTRATRVPRSSRVARLAVAAPATTSDGSSTSHRPRPVATTGTPAMAAAASTRDRPAIARGGRATSATAPVNVQVAGRLRSSCSASPSASTGRRSAPRWNTTAPTDGTTRRSRWPPTIAAPVTDPTTATRAVRPRTSQDTARKVAAATSSSNAPVAATHVAAVIRGVSSSDGTRPRVGGGGGPARSGAGADGTCGGAERTFELAGGGAAGGEPAARGSPVGGGRSARRWRDGRVPPCGSSATPGPCGAGGCCMVVTSTLACPDGRRNGRAGAPGSAPIRVWGTPRSAARGEGPLLDLAGGAQPQASTHGGHSIPCSTA